MWREKSLFVALVHPLVNIPPKHLLLNYFCLPTSSQPATHPPTWWWRKDDRRERKRNWREERESYDQYPGPIPTWIISLPLFWTLFPFAACMCMYAHAYVLGERVCWVGEGNSMKIFFSVSSQPWFIRNNLKIKNIILGREVNVSVFYLKRAQR